MARYTSFLFQVKSFLCMFIALQISISRKCGCAVILLFFSLQANAQQKDSTTLSRSAFTADSLMALHAAKNVHTLPEYPYNKKKVKTVAFVNAGIYAASMVGLYAAWYKNYPQGKFHVFNDIKEWKQVDKIGHVYSAYTMGRYSMELWRITGIERKKRIWIGGISGAVYQTVIEILDGFSTEWGWSWGDIGGNLLGSGALVAQELAWNDQRIQLKTSFHRKHYADASLNDRSRFLFGKSSAERYLKDYNGQTYWFSANIKSFFPSSRIPAWLQVAVGTGAEGLFGANENIGKDKSGNIIFNRPDIQRYRQWYLSPDIDLTKIKTSKKGIRLALIVLNALKFPAPAIEYGNNRFKWKWLFF